MLAFFKGWRRKAGCLLLGVACAFLALWVRAHRVDDVFGYSLNGSRLIISTHPDRVVMWSWDEADVEAKLHATPILLYSGEIPGPNAIEEERRSLRDSVSYALVSGSPIWQCEILYCVAVWPVALASAYLILWKPRPKDEPHA